MKLTLIVSTYNWPNALRKVLQSAARQTRLPDELIIADDGSRADTSELIYALRPTLPFPLHHVWQEDKGFRKALVMNKAFAIATGDYIVCIDGDIVMERHFLSDHERLARPHTVLLGSRCKLRSKATEAYLSEVEYRPLSCFSPGIRRRYNALRLTWLTPHAHRRARSIGCNISFWRDDIVRVNGYDEAFEGYGKEDSDIVMRLEKSGCTKQRIKYSAIAFHLYHPEREDTDNKNRRLFEVREKTGDHRARAGMDAHDASPLLYEAPYPSRGTSPSEDN